jgi:hypothetical protein
MNTILQDKWMIIASIELLIILFLLIKLRKVKKTEILDKEILKSKASSINMPDIMNDINLAPNLYKKLSRACHPDSFAGTNLEITANELFQEAQLAENNYAKLCDLKKQIEQKLNLSIS